MKIGNRKIEVSHRDKLLFPEAGLTKGDLIDYYARIADVMAPHILGRPLTLYRFPDGADAEGFYQKNAPDYFPGWIERVHLGKEEKLDYCVCREPAALVYLASQVCVPHIWLSQADRPDRPDRLVFDLDPGPDTTFDVVRATARSMFELLLDIGLVAYLMTTGSRGLHVVVPLDRTADYAAAREFARGVADVVASTAPEQVTTEHRKNKRGGRLFIDTYRNAYGQTTVAPYAVRANSGAAVATPIEWDALDDAKLRADRYGVKNIFRRLGQKQDPWRDINRNAANLRAPGQRLDKLQRRHARRRA
ncbi:MAG TPA: non-homologous end-joining DNA ligase [Gammaproteobacteria bacterium]|nr:non-homologous end-joining DNA ligase [Gammaproteobacteria bacterium]